MLFRLVVFGSHVCWQLIVTSETDTRMHRLFFVDFLLQEMPSFRVLNCLTTFLAVSIFGITISASIVNWYALSEQITLVPVVTGSSTAASSDTLLYNRTDVTWNLQQRTTSTYFDRKATNVASTYTSDQAIFSIIKLVQAFAITALLLSGILSIYFVLVFFAGFRAKIVYSWGATGARRIAMLTSLFVVISVVIAFLATTGITQALKTDNPVCTDGKNSIASIPTVPFFSGRPHFSVQAHATSLLTLRLPVSAPSPTWALLTT